jgi:hypothetical protein
MKTTVEVNGYEIVIEEKDGLVTVSATKDDEVVEEFELETEEGQSEDSEGDDVQDFDSFGQDEEEDFEDENEDEDEDSEFENEDEDSEFEDEEENSAKLESFQSFINKRK